MISKYRNNSSVSVYSWIQWEKNKEKKKTFCVLLDSDSVTHIVAENNSYLEVLDWLKGQAVGDSSRFELLDISWFTACMEAGRPVDSEMKYRLMVRQINYTLSYHCALVASLSPALL